MPFRRGEVVKWEEWLTMSFVSVQAAGEEARVVWDLAVEDATLAYQEYNRVDRAVKYTVQSTGKMPKELKMAEARLLTSLLEVVPEDLKSLVLHRQNLSLSEVLFVLMTAIEPGGASDRTRVRESVFRPPSHSDPQAALEAIRRRQIDINRLQQWGVICPDPELEVMCLKHMVRRVDWGSERQLRLSLWDVHNSPVKLPEQVEEYRSLIQGELHAMSLEKSRPPLDRNAQIVKSGYSRTPFKSGGDAAHGWKPSSSTPVRAQQIESGGKGKASTEKKMKDEKGENSKGVPGTCYWCGEPGHWKSECPKRKSEGSSST
ncbi:MAG: hypothetical protein EOP33_09475, partial [Rickettsiaceae bacterium]